MIIEWHTHVYPPEETGDEPTFDGKSGPGWGNRCPMTVENVLDAHHKAGVAVSVVSNACQMNGWLVWLGLIICTNRLVGVSPSVR